MPQVPSSPLVTSVDAAARTRCEAGQALNRTAEADLRSRIGTTIEAEIVPRLMLALSASRRALAASNAEGAVPDAADVAELTRLLLAHDIPVGIEFVEMLRQRGVPPDQICMHLIAPTARRLRRLWERRQCEFDQLELGLHRLRAVLQHFSGRSG